MDATGTIAIVTDATADVPAVERDAIDGVPWIVLPEFWRTADGLEFLDDGSGTTELAGLLLESGLDPEPSEPSRDDFVAAYARLREIDRVFSVHSPSSASWAVENAREAAGAFPNVRVVEAGVTGIGLGLLASRARDLAAEGVGPDRVEQWLRAHREAVRMLVVPDRFQPATTQRGQTARLLTGRSSAMLHSGAPGAVMDRSRQLRSRRATVAAIERYFLEHSDDGSELSLALAHGEAAGAVDPFLDLLERLRPHAEVELVGRVGPRLLQQLGARCVAAAWLEERAAVQDDPEEPGAIR